MWCFATCRIEVIDPEWTPAQMGHSGASTTRGYAAEVDRFCVRRGRFLPSFSAAVELRKSSARLSS